MDRSKALLVVEREAARILALAEEDRTSPGPTVPSCPEWTLADIPSHLGRVYAMVATVLQGEPDAPPDRDLIPRRHDDQAPTEWMRDRLAVMLALLREVPEDGLRWNFAAGPASPVSFWWRRQAHETLIHRVDAELAGGTPVAGVEPEVAADGIGDFLLLAGFTEVEPDDLDLGDGMSVHLHATDVASDAEWTLDTGNRTYACSHLKADVALRGDAWSLDRWCWRRLGLAGAASPSDPGGEEGLVTYGDVAAANAWRARI